MCLCLCVIVCRVWEGEGDCISTATATYNQSSIAIQFKGAIWTTSKCEQANPTPKYRHRSCSHSRM